MLCSELVLKDNSQVGVVFLFIIMVQLKHHDIVAWQHGCAQQLLDAASMEVSGPSSSAAVPVPYRQCLVALQDLTCSMFCGLVLIFFGC